MFHWCLNQFTYEGNGVTWYINLLLAQRVALVTHLLCNWVPLFWLHRAVYVSTSISSFTYSLLFWLTQFVQEHTSMHNSPASRQEHFLTSTHYLYVQYRWVRSRTSSGGDCALSEWRVHRRKLTSYDQLVQSALSLGCGFCTKLKYDIWHEWHALWRHLRFGEALLLICRLSWP